MEQLTRLSFFDILVLIIVTIFILSGSDEYAKKIQQTKRIDQKFSEKPNRPSDCRYRLYLPSGTVSQHQPWHRISESYASDRTRWTGQITSMRIRCGTIISSAQNASTFTIWKWTILILSWTSRQPAATGESMTTGSIFTGSASTASLMKKITQ